MPTSGKYIITFKIAITSNCHRTIIVKNGLCIQRSAFILSDFEVTSSELK
jgi:hypothetical protein